MTKKSIFESLPVEKQEKIRREAESMTDEEFEELKQILPILQAGAEKLLQNRIDREKRLIERIKKHNENK